MSPESEAGAVLAADECHVWWAAPTQCSRWHSELLDPIETARQRSYQHAADRDRFTVGVALTRLVLGPQLGVGPQSVPIDRTCARCGGPHGRPRLATGASIDFSLSHSGDVIALAVASSVDSDGSRDGDSNLGSHRIRRRVGIDVEQLDGPAGREAPADVALSATELLAYRTLDAAAQPAAFFRYWVRKEALLKATGDGLTVPMTRLTMTAPDQPPRLVSWRGRPGFAALVAMHDLRARPGYLAALAIIGRDVCVIGHDAAGLIAGRGLPAA
jgi:4'-phosphopantetheinyl transferase